MKLDPFIEAEKTAGHSVHSACRLLEVSKSAYYQRRNGAPSARQLSDAELTEKITAIHAESKGTYGAPRVHKELLHRHIPCGKRKVTRLMRLAGLEGRCKKRWRTTTVADPDAEAARDLIQRHFGPCEEMDRRYVGDITYIATWEGWAYLATVIDLASRKVVGWALADHMRTELVTDALTMAFANRAPERGVIFHSDRGCQGEINWSSQHLNLGGVRWRRCESVNARSSSIGGTSPRPEGPALPGERTGFGSGRRSLAA
jgi:putative transposase